MNFGTLLKDFENKLKIAGIATARLDTLILVEDAVKKDRAWLLANPEFKLTKGQENILNKQIERRLGHEPLAYIRGKSEFYGREFLVTPATLQPRPETETMIDILKRLNRAENMVLADIGTGSGCIAITAKLEWPDAEVYATEINEDALKIAEKNAKKLGAEVGFYKGNLLQPLQKNPEINILLCNLPYVPDGHTINQAAMQEPKIAIFGGPDGLDLYRELFDQVSKIATKLQFIFTESLPFQHEALTAIAKQGGFHQTDEEDFIQVFQPD